jgi:hypothetical protein
VQLGASHNRGGVGCQNSWGLVRTGGEWSVKTVGSSQNRGGGLSKQLGVSQNGGGGGLSKQLGSHKPERYRVGQIDSEKVRAVWEKSCRSCRQQRLLSYYQNGLEDAYKSSL